MIERLGNVLYWLSCICAALCLVAGVGMMFVFFAQSSPADHAFAPWAPLVGTVAAFICWLTGRALRYIFAGH